MENYVKTHLGSLYGKMTNVDYGLNPEYSSHSFIPLVVVRHVASLVELNHVSPDQHDCPKAYDFYIDRINAVPLYGEKAGTDLLKLICRCAFHDYCLTEAESISIINICHSPQWYKIWKEMNFNEGWN